METELRDFFAMQIAASLLGSYPTMGKEELAEKAYEVADCMLLEREKKLLPVAKVENDNSDINTPVNEAGNNELLDTTTQPVKFDPITLKRIEVQP